MTRLERTIRQVSDLRDFYLQLKKLRKPRRGRGTHADQDHLAGTWREKDAKTFARRTAALRQVDKELWK
jgi:hypothetical protein